MDKYELERRTKKFAVDVIRFVAKFDRTAVARVITSQLLKSATSIGANYREANRSLSRREFTHKVTLVEKEASETEYWLEICLDVKIGSQETTANLLNECRELVAIFTSIGRSMRANDRRTGTTSRGGVADNFGPEYAIDSSNTSIIEIEPLMPTFEEE